MIGATLGRAPSVLVPGRRDAARLARGWGIDRACVIKAITTSATYVTSFAGRYTMCSAMAGLLKRLAGKG